ncbi:hypothetical protein [Cysteiniphilum sp. JM-1]|uniref:hypothetical protein n=1 Tax=Cysteiniphilum sp. JM-1 TaxID=2610891 RepID=UPI001244C8A7|nr:hypothetical protein [Cysteiniphilum sp. JM-1]
MHNVTKNESTVFKLKNLRKIRLLEQVKPFFDILTVIFSIAFWPLLIGLCIVYVMHTHVGGDRAGPLLFLSLITPFIIIPMIISFIVSIALILRGYARRDSYKQKHQKLWDKYEQKTSVYYKSRAKKIWIICSIIIVGLTLSITIASLIFKYKKANFLESKQNVIKTFLAKNYPDAKFYDVKAYTDLRKGETNYFTVRSKKYLGHYFDVSITKSNSVSLDNNDLTKAKQELAYRQKYFKQFDVNKIIFNIYSDGLSGYIDIQKSPEKLLEFMTSIFEIYQNINNTQKTYLKVHLVDLPEPIDSTQIDIPFDWRQLMYYKNSYAIRHTWGLLFIADCKNSPSTDGCNSAERGDSKYTALDTKIKSPLDIAKYIKLIPTHPVKADIFGDIVDSWAISRRYSSEQAQFLVNTPLYQQIVKLTTTGENL